VPGWCATIPFRQGAREIVRFYDENPNFEALRPDVDALMDRLADEAARAKV
jgi:hypothetical protein